MKTLGALISAAFVLGACGGPNGPRLSKTSEAIDPLNDPLRLNPELGLSRDPDVFPSSGQSARAVWSGHWWPLSEGGTNARRGAARSPMEKYDLATANQGRAAAWEQQRASEMGQISWAGHCNGLAAAGLNEREPSHVATYGGVAFTPEDVKALLIEKWQNATGVSLVGGRCNSAPTSDPSGRTSQPKCRDLNPGSFHILLGNLLGLRQEAFILDITADEQVWNYPVVAYSTALTEVDVNQAISLVGLQGSSYTYDVNATQFMQAQTTVRLATGQTKVYEYLLEGRNGLITGGEWLGGSRGSHPDFAWTMSTPRMENPGLSIARIDEIAAGSL